jgi:hypothetical protein
MCQFQYQIGHCEIAMDTSMTNPLSATITNKGRNWFARTPWLPRIALNSLIFSCSPAIGGPHFLLQDLAQRPPERSLEYPRRRARNWAGDQHAVLRIFPQARTVGASFDDRSNSRPPSHRNWPSQGGPCTQGRPPRCTPSAPSPPSSSPSSSGGLPTTMFGFSTAERMSAVHYVIYRRFNRNRSANRKSLNIIDTDYPQFI